MTKTKLLSAIAALVAVLALAPASFGQICADCGGDGGGGGGAGNNPPTAAFSSGPASPQTFDNVTFTNSSTDSDGSIASSSWDFGDGATSTATSPAHAYGNGGTYNVTLTVTDNSGAPATVTHQLTVANRMPTASFSASGVVQAGEDIAIQNSSSDPEGHIASYDWSFGDGTTASQATPAKSYAAPGTYAVTLKVTDDKGSWSFASKSIRVDAPPTAQIIVAASQTAGIAVQFDSSSSDSDGTVQSYAWDFGDGTQGSGGTPVHTYAAAGSYNVQLTVTDNDGASGHAQVTVNVAAAPTSGGGGPSSGGGSGSNTGAIAGDGTGAPTITNTSGGGSGSPADAAATGAPASSDTTAPALVVPATLKAKKKAGKLVYTVSVNEAATLKAQLKGKVAGAATVKITKAGSGKVVIKLSGKARKALRAAKSVKLTLVTTATDAAGNTATKTTKVTLV